MVLAGFSTFSLLYSVQPLLPLFASEYRLRAEQASLAVSFATGAMAPALLVAAVLSDRMGRERLMSVSLLAAASLTLATAAAPNWLSVLLLRLLTGLALAGVPAVAMAYVSEEVEFSSVGSAMGLYIAGSALGGMSGRLLTSLIADRGGWRTGLVVVSLVSLAMGEAFRRLVPPSHRRGARRAVRRSVVPLLKDGATPLLLIEAFVLMGVFVTIYNYAGFRLMAAPYRLSSAAVGGVFLLYIVGSFSSAWFGTIAAKVGPQRTLWITVMIVIAGVAMTAARPLALVIAGIGVVTAGFFGAHSIASAWIGSRAGSARSQATALYLFCYYMGSSILGSAGGVAWTHAGWPGVTLFCLSLGLIAFGTAIALARSAAMPRQVPADVALQGPAW